MAGVFGVACGLNRTGLAGLVAEMARRLRHHPWYREQRWTDDVEGVGLGRVTSGPNHGTGLPAINKDGTLRAVLHGEILDYSERRRALEQAGHRFSGASHAELL